MRINQDQLLDYYLGILPENQWLDAEETLLESQPCLLEYLSIKREMECGKGSAGNPCGQAKRALRNEVEVAFAPTQGKLLKFKRYRKPAIAASVILAVAGVTWWNQGETPEEVAPIETVEVDTSLDHAATLVVF